MSEWTPIEKSKPDDMQEVLVTWVGYYNNKKEYFVEWGIYDADDNTFTDYEGDKHINVIAWMPLPKPYEGEKA